MNKEKLDKIFFFITIFLASLIAVDQKNGDYIYIVFLFFCFFVFLNRFSDSVKLDFYFIYFGFLCLSVVMTWGIAATLGIFYGAEPLNVFRNFFGLLVYFLFFPIALIRLKLEDFVVAFIWAAVVQVFEAFFILITSGGWDFSALATTITEARIKYSTGYLMIFPVLALSLYNFIFPRKMSFSFSVFYDYFLGKIALLIYLVVVCFITMSKGFILAVVLIFCCIYASLIFDKNVASAYKIKFSCILFLLLMALAMLFNEVFGILIDSYSDKDEGNSIRTEQYDYLIAELKFFGSGLGSVLESGYKRDETGYGFELTYINIIHKMGVFSIPVFMIYISVWYFIVKDLIFSVCKFYSIFALGAVAYQIVGLGNPVLLSAQSVLMHLVSMYIIVMKKDFLDK